MAKYHELVQAGLDGAKVQAKLQEVIGQAKITNIPTTELASVVGRVNALTVGDVK